MIWFTAKGAAFASAFAASWALSSVVMRSSHSSSCSFGRALSAGKEPTTPEMHCAMTRSGLEMMNSGAPFTGRPRGFRMSGFDIGFGLRGSTLACRLENPRRLGHEGACLVMYIGFDKNNRACCLEHASFGVKRSAARRDELGLHIERHHRTLHDRARSRAERHIEQGQGDAAMRDPHLVHVAVFERHPQPRTSRFGRDRFNAAEMHEGDMGAENIGLLRDRLRRGT